MGGRDRRSPRGGKRGDVEEVGAEENAGLVGRGGEQPSGKAFAGAGLGEVEALASAHDEIARASVAGKSVCKEADGSIMTKDVEVREVRAAAEDVGLGIKERAIGVVLACLGLCVPRPMRA